MAMKGSSDAIRRYACYVDAMKCDDLDAFTQYYKELVNVHSHMWPKGLVRFSIIRRLCVLYRKPRFLKAIHEIDQQPQNEDTGFGTGLTLIDIARGIGDDESVNVINKTCVDEPTYTDTRLFSYRVYKDCILMASKEPKCPEINAETIRVLADRGYNINEQGTGGRTPLHEAVLIKADQAIFNALVDNGADVDTPDDSGESAFSKLLHKLRYFNRQEVIQILQAFMRSNPRRDLYCDATDKTITSDDTFWRKVISKTDAKELYQAVTDPNSDLYREIVDKNLLTPILLKYGFKFNESLNSMESVYHPDLMLVFHHMLCNPQPLTHMCRITLRHAFPGKHILSMCYGDSIPKSIRAFILFEDELRVHTQ